MKFPILPIVYAKTPQARIIANMAYIYSDRVIGEISPYPTVVIVVKAQYKLATYLSALSESYNPVSCSQVMGSSS